MLEALSKGVGGEGTEDLAGSLWQGRSHCSGETCWVGRGRESSGGAKGSGSDVDPLQSLCALLLSGLCLPFLPGPFLCAHRFRDSSAL